MSLFKKLHIDNEQITNSLKRNWNLKIGNIIKSSQNQTLEAFNDLNLKFALRVVSLNQLQRVSDELAFIQYLERNHLSHVCSPVLTNDGKVLVVESDWILTVFHWAKGESIDFVQLKWLEDEDMIFAWGKFFAQLHNLSRQFSIEYPEVASRIQKWDEIHHQILKGVKLDKDDESEMDSNHFGIIHGDLNCSNFYFNSEEKFISVYDFDQLQIGFYEYDLAQAVFGVLMLEEFGMPISGTPVQVNTQNFLEKLVSAYQEESKFKLNKERLTRMVELKKEFYRRFCDRALKEGDIPPDMAPFITFIHNCLGPAQK